MANIARDYLYESEVSEYNSDSLMKDSNVNFYPEYETNSASKRNYESIQNE